MRRLLSLLAFIIAGAPVLLFAQGSLLGQGSSAIQRVTADPLSSVVVHKGSSTPVQFTFHVKPGFHINSNKPSTPELIPTVLSFSLPEDLVIGRMRYPAGALISFPFDPTQKLSVYSGDFVVKGLLISQPKATPGPYTVHAELRYQACDNNACYPPKRLPLTFNVKISSGGRSGPKARPNRMSPHIHAN
jgi:hypothetical protein